jgi:hypothetical protein
MLGEPPMEDMNEQSKGNTALRLTPTTAADRITAMNNTSDAYRNHIQDRIDHDRSLLSQRFNYFLLVTSLLTIVFVILITSDRFVACAWNDYAKIVIAISIVGFLLSYLLSIVNFMNVRLIYAMGWFLDNGTDSENIHTLRRFNRYVSNKLVPLLRFRIEYFWSVYLNTIAFILTTMLKLPFVDVDAKKTGYMDEAPHTWVAPILIAYAWLVICLMIFLDSYYSLLWWHLPVAIAIVSLIIGIVKGIRFHGERERVREERRSGG